MGGKSNHTMHHNMTGARPYEEADESQKTTIDTYNIECGVEYEYPESVLEGAHLDTDRDGMPDEWERARGLNPYSKYASDGLLESSEDYCGQGYTNIEYYINDLTVDAFPIGTVTVSPTVALPDFKVELQQNELVHTNAINSHINLINQIDDVFDLSKLKLRYYYKADNTGEQNVEIDDASITYEDDPGINIKKGAFA